MGPGNPHQSANSRLDISPQKHLCYFTNQLSTSLFFTNLHDIGQGQEHDLPGEDGGDATLPPPFRGHEELRAWELETQTLPVTLRNYLNLCGPHSLTHCPFQLSSKRTMAALQILYLLITSIFQMLIALKGSQGATDWKMVRQGHTYVHTHTGVHTFVSDAFHFPLHTISIFNTMSMYLTTVMFIFPLKFTFTLGDFFRAKKRDLHSQQDKPSQSGPVVGTK